MYPALSFYGGILASHSCAFRLYIELLPKRRSKQSKMQSP